LADWSEDTAVIFFFVLVSLMVFTGFTNSYGESPLVWGFALFMGIISVLIGAGLGILLPLFLIFVLFYFQGVTRLLGGGIVAWVFCAFVIMLLASAGFA
jgi:hypothetical protein